MVIYTVTYQADESRFDVRIVGSDGVRQTMLGFQTEAAAEAWIAEDQHRDRSDSLSRYFALSPRF